MTTTRIYKSTDASSPVLVGGVSSLINLLDKCLVTGYGSATAAGWTKPYAGTDIAVFRNSVAAGGSGMYLRVSDAGSGTGGAREALVRGYATMSDANTGTVETPTVAQIAASLVWRKSNTVDSTARPWILIADERTFYLCIDTGTFSTEYGAGLYGAGDFQSLVPGDPYPWFVAGRETQAGAGAQGIQSALCLRSASFATPSSEGIWLPRGYAGTGSPIRAALAMPGTTSGTIGAFNSINNLARPALGSGLSLWVAGLVCAEATVRGILRGLHCPLNDFSGVVIGTEYASPPGLPSGVLVTMRHNAQSSASSASDGHVMIDRVGPWS
jgi:hypothetical protein